MMKKKMKSKMLAMLMSLAVVFTMIPVMSDTAYARENTDPSVIKNGDVSNFAKDAPITTITIDRSKIHKDNLVFTEPGKLDQLPNSGTSIVFTFSDGYAYAEGVDVNADYKRLGNFTFVYKDAAIMRDGTRENLEVIFDEINVIREKGKPEEYDNEKIRIAYAGDHSNGKPLSLTPLSVKNSDKHFAIRSEIKFRAGKGGRISDEEESFFFTASDINIKNSSSNIVNDYGNQNYSESVEPLYGINSESDIYLPQSTNITDNPSGGGWNRTSGGYEHRFMVNSKAAVPSTDPYDFGLAIAVRAGGRSDDRKNNGYITRAWASSGPDFQPSEIHFMNYDLTHSFTSFSGDNGEIVLWTDGQIHDTDAEKNKFRKLDGGNVNTPYTYAVPHGKEVTYKMTPDPGYILDTLTVNGTRVYPTGIVYKADSSEIDYYKYTFGEDTVNENKNISVTWKLPGAASEPIPVRKIITGDVPDKDQEFTCVMEGTGFPSGQSGKSTAATVKLKVEKGQTEANSEIPGLTFKKPGEYIYNVRELNESAAGYTYDDKVYTVKYVVEPDPDDPDDMLCTKQTILDGKNEVKICEFVNKYERGNKSDPTPTPGKTGGILLSKVKAGKTKMTIRWNKVKGVAGYDIFLAKCNRHGKKFAYRKVKTIKGNKTFVWKKSGLKKGTAYKFYVKAYTMKAGKKTYIRKSPAVHSYTGNGTGNFTNAKSVTLRNVRKGKLSLKKGKTFRIKAKVNKVNKKKKLMPKSHTSKLRYLSSDRKVATVSKSGRITAKGTGKCTIYVFAHNGVSKSIRVTVP
ncbi:MAG: Ig-like domain-containing protein [Mogibacterium sp.]|nr:Ig-like domain-containing protein [Mogibacterium sp.]